MYSSSRYMVAALGQRNMKIKLYIRYV